MSETRRQIFKTSVLSAVGLMTGAAVTACARYGIAEQGPDPDFTVPIVGYSAHLWYVFVTDDGVKYAVFSTKAQIGSSRPSLVKFDTKRYLAAARDAQDGANLQRVTTPFKIDEMKFKFGNDGFLDSDSASQLRAGANHEVALVHWSEIGQK